MKKGKKRKHLKASSQSIKTDSGITPIIISSRHVNFRLLLNDSIVGDNNNQSTKDKPPNG